MQFSFNSTESDLKCAQHVSQIIFRDQARSPTDDAVYHLAQLVLDHAKVTTSGSVKNFKLPPNFQAKLASYLAPNSEITSVWRALDTATQQPLSTNHRQWRETRQVNCASVGVRGAWFFSTWESNLVVKGQENALYQVIGSVFLSLVGINAPDIRIIPCDSAEGSEIAEVASQHQHNIQQRQPDAFIAMECVYGRSFEDLCGVGDLNIVKAELKSLGKLLFYDLLLGNFDRFELNSTGINGGNFLFSEHANNKSRLVTIDTDCVPNSELENKDQYEFTRLALKKIAQGKSEGYCQKTVSKIFSHFNTEPIEPAVEVFQEGLNEAMHEILSITTEMLVSQLNRAVEKRMVSCENRADLYQELTEVTSSLAERIEWLRNMCTQR